MLTNLANVRLSKGVSQRQLAADLRTTPNVICRYEKGRNSPSVDTALKIAAVLGVSVEDLTRKDAAEERTMTRAA